MKAPVRPNVLVLISDDTDPAYLGPYGGPYPTPNFDWLAREGMRLARHEVVAPICTPSRYAYLTGQFPGRCQGPAAVADREAGGFPLIGFNREIRPGQASFATIFRESGYWTGYVGKFHCGRPAAELGMRDIEDDMPEAEADRRRRHNHRMACEEMHRLGWDYADHLAWGNIDYEPWIKLDTHNLEWTTEGACRFLDAWEGASGRPFCLTVATNVIHGPKHGENILEEDPLQTPAGRLSHPPVSGHPERRTVVERLRRSGLNPTHRAVGAVWLDDCLGALRAKLEAMGQLDNTLIIYQTDHAVLGKSSCHVTGSRTGFLARWPGFIPAGSVCARTVQNVDFLPTLAELLGLRVPEDYVMDGRSYAPALLGQALVSPEDWYNEVGTARSVQTREFKYIAFRYQPRQIERMRDDPARRLMNQIGLWQPWMPEFHHPHYWEPEQLYRIDHDELEQINLASLPRYAGVLEEMKGRLRRHLRRLGDSFPEEADPFQRSGEFQARLAARRARAIEELAYFHTGGW